MSHIVCVYTCVTGTTCLSSTGCSRFRTIHVCCSVLQCVAVCCSVLQCGPHALAALVAAVSERFMCVAICRSVSYGAEFVAVCCSVLQCAAVCCSVLQCVVVCCGVLQCIAVCCSVLT